MDYEHKLPTSDALNCFFVLNRTAVDEEGIKIPHMVTLQDGGLNVHALAMTGPQGPEVAYAHLGRVLVRERPAEVVFGLDRFTKPGQGIDTRDCLSVHHWNGHRWRFGVIPYQFEPSIFGPIDWCNSFWREKLTREMTSAWKQIVAAPHREPSPAMFLPLQVEELDVTAANHR